MKHLYSFTLSLPLTYCTYDLRSDDSELIFGLANNIEWDESLAVDMPCPMDESKRYHATEKIHFCISSKFTENVSDDAPNCYQMPDKFFMCVISGIVAESKNEARGLVSGYITKACKALSLLMSCSNRNKQGYQPRVEADYHLQEWVTEEYEPYEALVMQAVQPQEYIDENGDRVIQIYTENSTIAIECSSYCTMFGKLNTSHFFDYYNYEKSPVLSFLIDEYYAALGREAATSKFFHLFAIIEFIEKEFVDLADTQRVFDENDKQQVLECLEHLDMAKEKRERLRGFVTGSMGRATELGREAKLVNILHNMGIQEFKECGTPFLINKSNMKELTALRNSFFHGDGKKVEQAAGHISVETAVARLMDICERIIVYVAADQELLSEQACEVSLYI